MAARAAGDAATQGEASAPDGARDTAPNAVVNGSAAPGAPAEAGAGAAGAQESGREGDAPVTVPIGGAEGRGGDTPAVEPTSASRQKPTAEETAAKAEEFARYNPFDESFPWTAWDVLRTVIASVTLLPVRVLLFLLLVFVGWLVCLITISGRGDYDPRRGRFRRRPVGPCCNRALLVFLQGVVRCGLFVLGFHWIRRKAPAQAPSVARVAPAPAGASEAPAAASAAAQMATVSPKITVANHPGSIDVLAVFLERPGRFLGKSFFGKVPVMRTYAKAVGCIWVDRGDQESRVAAREALREVATSQDPSVLPIILFPEGTTTNGKALIRFQAGSFRAGAPVQPILVKLPHRFFNPAWAAITFGSHAFRLLTQLHNSMTVEVLPPYLPSEEEAADPILYAQNCRNEMARAGAMRVSELDYRDGLRWWTEVFLSRGKKKAAVAQ